MLIQSRKYINILNYQFCKNKPTHKKPFFSKSNKDNIFSKSKNTSDKTKNNNVEKKYKNWLDIEHPNIPNTIPIS